MVIPTTTLRRRGLLALASLAPATAMAQPTGMLRRIREDKSLRIGVWLGAPPWGGYDDLGAPDGAEIELARLLARDLDVVPRLVRLTARERLAAVVEGRVDVLAAALPITPYHLTRLAFAAAHGTVAAVIVTRRGAGITGFAQLANKRVAMPAGTVATETAHDLMPDSAEAVFLPDAPACLAALLTGSVDAAVTYDWELRAVLLSHPDAEIEFAVEVARWRHALAVPLGEHDLLRFINTFLFLRSADGSLGEIHQRYFNAPVASPMLFR